MSIENKLFIVSHKSIICNTVFTVWVVQWVTMVTVVSHKGLWGCRSGTILIHVPTLSLLQKVHWVVKYLWSVMEGMKKGGEERVGGEGRQGIGKGSEGQGWRRMEGVGKGRWQWGRWEECTNERRKEVKVCVGWVSEGRLRHWAWGPTKTLHTPYKGEHRLPDWVKVGNV